RVNRRDARLPGTHRMTGEPTPFGVDETQLPEVLDLAWGHPALRVVGFALHAVSNNLNAAAHAEFVADAVAWSMASADQFGLVLDHVNLGGGFGIDYTGEATFDLDRLADGLAEAVTVLPGGTHLVFELGRYLSADAGWYAAEVLDLKFTHGRWFAVLRG